jgi:hypothetical protein
MRILHSKQVVTPCNMFKRLKSDLNIPFHSFGLLARRTELMADTLLLTRPLSLSLVPPCLSSLMSMPTVVLVPKNFPSNQSHMSKQRHGEGKETGSDAFRPSSSCCIRYLDSSSSSSTVPILRASCTVRKTL